MSETNATLLDTASAGRILGLRGSTLAAWRRRGSGPAYVRLGRLVRYRCDDLMSFVAQRAVNPIRHPLAARVLGLS
ncbi:MAG: helix-turn-helix domain-containing protein [Deltaproteobacteria bacterium]|nr:helix-turn-helix domain-containing protein [Deltaproteobacteria bacterium]